MAKKVIKKYQGNTGSSTTGPATNGPKAKSRPLYRPTPPPPPDTRSTNEKVGITRPTNKPAVSPIRQLKKGGKTGDPLKATTDSRTKKGLADGKMSKGILDYSAREIAEGIYNTEKANFKGASDAISKAGTAVYNEAKRKSGQASDAFDATYNFLFKKKGGSIKKVIPIKKKK